MVRSGTNKEIKKDYLFPFKMVMQEKSRVLNHGYYLIHFVTFLHTAGIRDVFLQVGLLPYSRFIIILDNVTAHME